MIKHIVLWKLQESNEPAAKEKNLLEMKLRLESLKQAIPQIVSLQVGLNCVDLSGNADIVLVSEFETLEALNVYRTHPAHLEAVQFIRTISKERWAVDYEDVER